MDKTAPSNLRRVEFRPLKETVYNMLVASITSGELSPGTSVTIAELSGRLGVSLMPVREALRKLESENLITLKKNRRIAINELSKEDLNELLLIRLNLECMISRIAIPKIQQAAIAELQTLLEQMNKAKNPDLYFDINKRFHFIIYDAAKMPILKEIIDNLWRRVSSYLRIYVATTYREPNLHCHREMLSAIKSKNAPKLVKWLTLDLTRAAEAVGGFLSSKT